MADQQTVDEPVAPDFAVAPELVASTETADEQPVDKSAVMELTALLTSWVAVEGLVTMSGCHIVPKPGDDQYVDQTDALALIAEQTGTLASRLLIALVVVDRTARQLRSSCLLGHFSSSFR